MPSYLTQPGKVKDNAPASAIRKHLTQNGKCLETFERNQFTFLATARTQSKLDTVEAPLTLDLSKQKKFVTKVHLF